MMEKQLQILQEVLALLSTPDKFVAGTESVDKDGKQVRSDSPECVRFSLPGALTIITLRTLPYRESIEIGTQLAIGMRIVVEREGLKLDTYESCIAAVHATIKDIHGFIDHVDKYGPPVDLVTLVQQMASGDPTKTNGDDPDAPEAKPTLH